jgi:MoaA/NifB/PqqE/SkfB family radical SAM enzyme/predicted SAM-dependent methyltransferase
MEQIRAHLGARAGGVEVHRSSEIQLYELLERVDYHVSQTCTTVIEAEEFGVPNIIVGEEGARWYAEEIEKGYYLHAEAPIVLIEMMTGGALPVPRPAPLLQTDSEAAWSKLQQLLTGNHERKGEAMPLAPHIFTIETTLACDLRCPECAIGGGLIQREKGLMSFESYREIADKIRPYARYVYLHIWGDPMLNPDIFEMIRYTSAFAGTNISTNGQSLNREKAQELIRSGVSDVIVSIDGATQEVYQQYRVGGDIGKAFRALALLVEENRLQGGKVNIIPQFIVFEHNQHEMDLFSRRCAELGLSPAFKAPYLRKSDSRFAYCDTPAFQRPHYQDLASLQNAMSGCPNPREVFTVLRDGSVVACCHDYAGATSFGNIFQEEVISIWTSPAFEKFRGAVTCGKAPEFCQKNCMTWFLDETPEAAPVSAQAQAPAPAPEKEPARVVNLCCGSIVIPGFINIDAMPGGDMQIDLERELLPFPDQSIDAVVCISAINYFSYQRGREIVADVYRVLKPGGVARFATQDLRLLALRYLERDDSFYFQKLADGRTRFPGETFCDKLNEFFYGFNSGPKHCKYVYDPESLSLHFTAAGFKVIREKPFRESAIPGAERFDNRPEQMFFLEAVKGEPAPENRYEKIMQEKAARMSAALNAPAGLRDRGLGLMQQNPERGWQLLLKALELDPSDRKATLACAGDSWRPAVSTTRRASTGSAHLRS